MANSLSTKAEKFTQMLDGIVLGGTKTADLNMNSEYVGEFVGAGKVQVAKIALQGLGDYTRGGGSGAFPAGDITFAWEPVTLNYDRGREFTIDAMDDEERAAVISANLLGEFTRAEVVPEVDAIRFAKLAAAATAGGTATATTYTTAAAAAAAVMAGEAYIEDKGSELSNCILYTTAAVKAQLREAAAYRFGVGENADTRFDTYDGMKVVTVPSARFYTAITLNDGTTSGEEAGGYAKATAGKDINFMIVDPACCAAIVKHEALRYFDPATNQTEEAHKWQYRVYHDLYVFDNKKPLIYLSNQA